MRCASARSGRSRTRCSRSAVSAAAACSYWSVDPARCCVCCIAPSIFCCICCMVLCPCSSSCFLIDAPVAAVVAISSPQPASAAVTAMTRSVFMSGTLCGNSSLAALKSPLPAPRKDGGSQKRQWGRNSVDRRSGVAHHLAPLLVLVAHVAIHFLGAHPHPLAPPAAEPVLQPLHLLFLTVF